MICTLVDRSRMVIYLSKRTWEGFFKENLLNKWVRSTNEHVVKYLQTSVIPFVERLVPLLCSWDVARTNFSHTISYPNQFVS